MQTNGPNGHQHEVSEKRPAPDIFTTRLDMEICACGAKRWVDLQGRPATPWQFINLVTRRKGQEIATTALRTPPRSALDGLITCGNCGQLMLLDDTQGDQEASYACQPGPGDRWDQYPTPRLNARRAEALLIGKALRTVLTDETISRVLGVAKRPRAVRRSTGTQADQAGHAGTSWENSERLVLAVGRTMESREFPPEHRPHSLVLYRTRDREPTRPGCLSQAS